MGREIKASVFYPSSYDRDGDNGDDILERKKAWAELEREQDEVKSNIRSLMRKAPESKEMENPLLAERVIQKREPSASSYRVPQDIILEQ